MADYTPFLKVKANEIAALATLAPEIRKALVPFFDLPKKKSMTADSFTRMVEKAAGSFVRHLEDLPAFYLDNFDIDDDIVVNGHDNYRFVIETFQKLPLIPVVGLDRVQGRNQLVFDAKADGLLQSKVFAVRLQADDFVSFELIKDEIQALVANGKDLFEDWILVLDNRVCLNQDVTARAKELSAFISDSRKVLGPHRTIIAGSSMPASTAELLKVQSEMFLERVEIEIHGRTCAELSDGDLGFGDYTIVSPLYSDSDIPPEVMLNVMAPRVVYSFDSSHFVARGGALRTHHRGNLQFNDIAKYLITKPFYRTPSYSFGDNFLYEKANFLGKQVTPGSILKPTINAHVTYMSRTYGLP